MHLHKAVVQNALCELPCRGLHHCPAFFLIKCVFSVLYSNSESVTKLRTATCIRKMLPSSSKTKLEDTPSVSLTDTEYVPMSTLSGFLKYSFELKGKRKASVSHFCLQKPKFTPSGFPVTY